MSIGPKSAKIVLFVAHLRKRPAASRHVRATGRLIQLAA
jgi:hypothetical protein